MYYVLISQREFLFFFFFFTLHRERLSVLFWLQSSLNVSPSKPGFISPNEQVGPAIGILRYGELSADAARDSEKRNGGLHEDGAPQRKRDMKGGQTDWVG